MTQVSTQRHRWNERPHRAVPACESPDGNDRTEKTCAACGLVKITAHGARGFPFRVWRNKDGHEWRGDLTPPCGAQVDRAISESCA